MSIPFIDQSDYLRDLEDLDDLMPATTNETDHAAEYEVVEDAPEQVAGTRVKPLPRSADDFIPQYLTSERLAPTPDDKQPLPSAQSDDGWGDEPAEKKGKTWFGSGGKAPESEDDLKKSLLARIEAYRSTWPWLEDKLTFPPNLHKKSPEKLKAILEECSNKVQNRNMTSMLGIIFSTTICAIENLCTSQLGWTDLRGFALECETDETIKNSVKEIEIKYFASSKAMAPEARLAIALLQKVVAVTSRNRGQRLLEEVARRSLDPRVAQEYQDL